MITTFPIFTKLTMDLRPEVEAITAQFDPYADFSFVNLYAWCMDNQTEISLLNDNLVVRLPDYIIGDTTMYSLIGNNKVDESLDKVLDLSDKLSLVPDSVVERVHDFSKYSIQEDRDDFDYIYNVRALATLEGGDFKKKRNKVHRIQNELGASIKTQSTTVLDQATAEELRAVFNVWAEDCQKSEEECKTEYMAIDRMLSNADSLDLLFTIVRIEGRICAFSVHELTAGNKAICHFEKALAVHDCLYAFVIYYTANELASRGVCSVNWQQDLGLPGLRQSKTGYQPTGFLKKYYITRA